MHLPQQLGERRHRLDPLAVCARGRAGEDDADPGPGEGIEAFGDDLVNIRFMPDMRSIAWLGGTMMEQLASLFDEEDAKDVRAARGGGQRGRGGAKATPGKAGGKSGKRAA